VTTQTSEATPGSGAGGERPKRVPMPKPPAPIVPDLTSAELRALAEQHSLRPMGVRPPLVEYVKDVLSRWPFIRVLGTSAAYAKNQNNYLGQLWALLNPILNATIYVLVFGVLLDASRGVDNSIAFIVIGVFLFRFIDQSVHGGAQSIAKKTSLIRSLHFPRAVLPISQVVSLLTTLVPTLVVMCVIVLLSGFVGSNEPIPVTWEWLLLPCIVALMWLFNTGLAFIMARVVAITPDLDNIISFVMRFAMYGSGVIFPVTKYAESLPDTAQAIVTPILEYQPIGVFLYVARSILMQEDAFPPSGEMWLWAAGWAVVTLVVGFIVFWRGEERYGRD